MGYQWRSVGAGSIINLGCSGKPGYDVCIRFSTHRLSHGAALARGLGLQLALPVVGAGEGEGKWFRLPGAAGGWRFGRWRVRTAAGAMARLLDELCGPAFSSQGDFGL